MARLTQDRCVLHRSSTARAATTFSPGGSLYPKTELEVKAAFKKSSATTKAEANVKVEAKAKAQLRAFPFEEAETIVKAK